MRTRETRSDAACGKPCSDGRLRTLNKATAIEAKKYGGVVFDDKSRVLLREPKNHFDDYVWTFAKGAPDSGETLQQAALCEVREETGVEAEIVGVVPGAFKGHREHRVLPDDA